MFACLLKMTNMLRGGRLMARPYLTTDGGEGRGKRKNYARSVGLDGGFERSWGG